MHPNHPNGKHPLDMSCDKVIKMKEINPMTFPNWITTISSPKLMAPAQFLLFLFSENALKCQICCDDYC